ncbi:MAG: ABC transporter permease [Gemmatimonadetes bacterium]|nr:ABC transporter permease [Gemmatimonadota bacterium]
MMVPYALRESLRAFRRTPLLAGLSATMIALSLFLVGLFGVAAWNVRRVLDRIEARVQVMAYLRDNSDPGAVTIAQTDIAQYPEVREVNYISKEHALLKAREELPEFASVFGDLETNPLPASLEILLRPNQSGPEAVEAIAARLRAYPFIEDVRFGSEWLDKVYLLRRVAGATTVALGTAFALVAALIIAAAIRMAIYARRDEILIMRLVGATESFVRRPFLLEGLFTGLAGGLIALAATRLAFAITSDTLFQLEWLPLEWVLGGIAAGALVGVLASGLAVHRYLKAV